MHNSSSFESCLSKQKLLKQMFTPLLTPEERYEKIIKLGQALLPYHSECKSPQNLVEGCQSQMYLDARLSVEKKVVFLADSDALISRGLAGLLIAIYSDEYPQVILTCPPSCLETIGIQKILSPSRSNGLLSLYVRMKQESLKYLESKKL